MGQNFKPFIGKIPNKQPIRPKKVSKHVSYDKSFCSRKCTVRHVEENVTTALTATFIITFEVKQRTARGALNKRKTFFSLTTPEFLSMAL